MRATRISSDPKRKRPKTLSSHGTPVEQPSPEVCSQPPYVLMLTAGMALMGYVAAGDALAGVTRITESEGFDRHPSRFIIPFSCSVRVFVTSWSRTRLPR